MLLIPTLRSEFSRQCYTVRPCLKKEKRKKERKCFRYFLSCSPQSPCCFYNAGSTVAMLCNECQKENRRPCALSGLLECLCVLPWLYFFAYFCSAEARLTGSADYLKLHLASVYSTLSTGLGLELALVSTAHPPLPSRLGMHSLAPFKIYPFPVPLHISAIQETYEKARLGTGWPPLYTLLSAASEHRRKNGKAPVVWIWGSSVTRYSRPSTVTGIPHS